MTTTAMITVTDVEVKYMSTLAFPILSPQQTVEIGQLRNILVPGPSCFISVKHIQAKIHRHNQICRACNKTS